MKCPQCGGSSKVVDIQLPIKGGMYYRKVDTYGYRCLMCACLFHDNADDHSKPIIIKFGRIE